MINSAERLKQILAVFRKYHLPKEITPVNVRMALEDLGPTFVKMGQILSSREDLIPRSFCEELSHLRSSVKPMEFSVVKEILENIYGKPLEEVFLEFDKIPIGSASIAQVHRAKLLDGSVVAVKVQREQIEELMKIDTNLLKKAIGLLHVNKLLGDVVDVSAVIDEMYTRALEEMDFNIEMAHIQKFANNNSGLVYMRPLKVYEELSFSHVLVMEFIEGNRISDVEELEQKGYVMSEIGEKLAHNYVKQAIEDGFYHADPHQDNIKIIDGKIAYLDFGMMGTLSTYNRDLLGRCIESIVKNDISTIARVLVMLDTKKDPVDYMQLKNDIKMVLDKNKNTGIVNINIKEFVSEMLSLLQANMITLPKEITMLIRGIVVLEGTLECVSPEINLVQVLENYFDYSEVINQDKIKEFLVDGVKSGVDMVMIPNELLTTLKGINTGELRFNIELTDSKHQIDRIERIVHLIIVTVLDVAFIIGASQMIEKIAAFPFIFYVYLSGAIICTVWLLFKLIFSKFRKL